MRYMVFVSLIIVLCMGMVILRGPTTYADRSDCPTLQVTQTAEITPLPPLQSPPSTSDILFNEVEPPSILMTAPCASSLAGKNTQQDGWIELYSTTSSSIDLYTQFCDIDSGTGTNPFAIEQGTILPARGFVVIYPYNSIFLATLTPTLRFLCNGIIMDQITVPTLTTGTSYARSVDGTGSWEITSHITEATTNTLPLLTPTPTTRILDNQTTRQTPSSIKRTQIASLTPSQEVSALIPVPPQPSPMATEKSWKAFRFPEITTTASTTHSSNKQQQQTRGDPSTNSIQPENTILLDITGVFMIMITCLIIWYSRKIYKKLRENRRNNHSSGLIEEQKG